MLKAAVVSVVLLLSTCVWAHPQCRPISHAGIDYADANITVVPSSTTSECCAACASHKGCLIGVWHNGEDKVCALKATSKHPVKGHAVLAIKPNASPPSPAPAPIFRFSNIHSSSMVLQSAPAQSAVWGFCHPEDSVTVTFNGSTINAVVTTRGPNNSTWTALLPATPASYDTHAVSASSSKEGSTVKLQDVLFGDVWVCSGQSNMAFSINGSNGKALVHPPVNNSQHEATLLTHTHSHQLLTSSSSWRLQ